MVEALRQARPNRGSGRKTASAKTFVPEELSIKYRPEEIKQRLLPGRWEGDLIKGPTTARPWAYWWNVRRDLSSSAG